MELCVFYEPLFLTDWKPLIRIGGVAMMPLLTTLYRSFSGEFHSDNSQVFLIFKRNPHYRAPCWILCYDALPFLGSFSLAVYVYVDLIADHVKWHFNFKLNTNSIWKWFTRFAQLKVANLLTADADCCFFFFVFSTSSSFNLFLMF